MARWLAFSEIRLLFYRLTPDEGPWAKSWPPHLALSAGTSGQANTRTCASGQLWHVISWDVIFYLARGQTQEMRRPRVTYNADLADLMQGYARHTRRATEFRRHL